MASCIGHACPVFEIGALSSDTLLLQADISLEDSGARGWFPDCISGGMRQPTERLQPSSSRPRSLVERSIEGTDGTAKPGISDLRARFNPRLVGFGIADRLTDVSGDGNRVDGCHQNRTSRNQA